MLFVSSSKISTAIWSVCRVSDLQGEVCLQTKANLHCCKVEMKWFTFMLFALNCTLKICDIFKNLFNFIIVGNFLIARPTCFENSIKIVLTHFKFKTTNTKEIWHKFITGYNNMQFPSIHMASIHCNFHSSTHKNPSDLKIVKIKNYSHENYYLIEFYTTFCWHIVADWFPWWKSIGFKITPTVAALLKVMRDVKNR